MICKIYSVIVPNNECNLLYTPYISRGFYFHEFRESGAVRKFINTRKYLPPIPTHMNATCVHAILVVYSVQHTVHMQMSE